MNHLCKGGRCHLMQGKVVPVLATVAGRFLCSNGLTMLSIQGYGNPWKPSVCTAGTGGNASWRELLRPSLELHDVRPGIGKSIGCPHRV